MAGKRKWVYLATGTLMFLFCGLLYGWSLFKVPFSTLYPMWSLPQLSLTFTISMVSFCVAAFIAGKLSAFLKPRYIIAISAIMILIGFLGISRLDPADAAGSLIKLYIFYGVFAGGGVGVVYNNVIATVCKWFPGRQGFATGVMLMGFGMGALVLGGIASRLVEAKGLLDAFAMLGVLFFVVLLLGALIIRTPAACVRQETDEKAPVSKTTAEMLKSLAFRLFFCWGFCLNTAGMMIINSAAPIALAYGAPALVGMIVAVFNGMGRLAIGAIFDQFGRKRTMLINSTILAAAAIFLLVGAKTAAVAFILLGLICSGFSYGGNPTTASAFVNQHFGPKHFAVNFSLVNFSAIPAALIGPPLSSSLIERSNGAYETTFITLFIFAGVAFVAWTLLNRSIEKTGGD